MLPWSYNLMLHALKRTVKEQEVLLSGLDQPARAAISDVLQILQSSVIIFKQMLALLKYQNDSQLMTFLRRVRHATVLSLWAPATRGPGRLSVCGRKLLDALSIGESLVLPAIIEVCPAAHCRARPLTLPRLRRTLCHAPTTH